MRSDEGDHAQAWAVQYDDGMSLTTASEQVAHSLAEAERQRGHRVTVRRLDDAGTLSRAPGPAPVPEPVREPQSAPAPEPPPAPEPELARAPKPRPAPEPAAEAARPGPARAPEPVHAVTPARHRRLLLYVLAAVCIVVAAALADHWNVLPRVGAGPSPAQVGSVHHGPQLLPPLGPPPVMHFDR